MRYARTKDRMNMITLLYEKTLNESMIDKQIDELEGQGLNSK